VSYFGRIASRAGAPAGRLVSPSTASGSPIALADQRLNLLGGLEIPSGREVARRRPAAAESLEWDDLQAGALPGSAGILSGDVHGALSGAAGALPSGTPGADREVAAATAPGSAARTRRPIGSLDQLPASGAGAMPESGSSAARGAITPDAVRSAASPGGAPAAAAPSAEGPSSRSTGDAVPAQTGWLASATVERGVSDAPLGATRARRTVASAIEAASEATIDAASTSARRRPPTERTAAATAQTAGAASPAATAVASPAERPDGARRAEAGAPNAAQALGEALSKVNAWMRRPVDPRVAEPAEAAAMAAPRSQAVPSSTRAQSWPDSHQPPPAPRLSIGRLEVEVVPPTPEPVRAAPSRAPAARGGGLSATFAAGEIAKLSFGLRGR
jgi:hypothetical protein